MVSPLSRLRNPRPQMKKGTENDPFSQLSLSDLAD